MLLQILMAMPFLESEKGFKPMLCRSKCTIFHHLSCIKCISDDAKTFESIKP